MYEERKSLGFLSVFSLFVISCQNYGVSLCKETIKLYHYVTMGLAACSVDL